MEQIKCSQVTIGYEGNRVATNLDFSIHQGDYLCIVGENGAGKTTLIKCLLGLKKPLEGEITFQNGLARQEIGYLPQQKVNQKDFPATVNEIVLSGMLGQKGIRPFYNKEEKKRGLESMEKLEIAHLKSTCYRHLSGGQQQRVLLARALCATDKILFLDEPVAGLDEASTKEMYKIAEKLNKEEGVTIVMISHDIETAMAYASHILHIQAGKQQYFGEIEDYAAIRVKALDGGGQWMN